ncbi:paramyosin, putative [Pediculus humanus corporis]|uniref:Paramyosin, putative n=1 Tax=Pediculus humanus subsp. corporis TaxID=121224 RepID=E0W2Y6_PEDHC|nr:paramyosin, putative [Pediculus humanus corporis]EEB19992.1 paramyosin, putative [Pediculus humanus corporis]
MVTFVVGELFSSFNDLSQKLSEYSEQNFCHFYIKDSKKLSPNEVINPQLIYRHIVYSCIYGGQKPRFRGSGSRSVSSIRHGCPANVYLRVTKDREHLQVRSFVETHNHEISEDLKTEVEELLLLGADKDRLCDYIRYVTKKNLDKKNLFNIYDAAVKHQREISRDRALMLIQKVYAVETEEEAEQILQQLLLSDKPTRRSRKQEPVEYVENIEVAFVNEGDSSQEEIVEERVDDLTIDQRIEKLMSTITGENEVGDHIVIVQDGEHIQVIDTGDTAVEEYLTGDATDSDKVVQPEEVMVKQEIDDEKTQEIKQIKEETPRYLTLKELSKSFQTRKRKVIKTPPIKKKFIPNNYVQTNAENAVLYTEPLGKNRVYTSGYEENEEEIMERDDYAECKRENARAELEKLITETEMLKLKRNKIVKDISKLEVEKNKLCLEMEVIKEKKKSVSMKIMCLETEFQTRELQNEKLRLEIAKLKFELNEN